MSNSPRKWDHHWLPIFETLISISMLCFGGSSALYGQDERYNHPELHWKVLTTEHFQVVYHTEAEWTARKIAAIAEQVWEPITELYHYRPEGKVFIIVRDHDDFSNGATYYYQQKIEIWATPLDFELRGNHHWLTDVVTHEFTHLVQLGASRKGPRNLPNLYLQSISYEPERRPDVLYGYPNRLISFPIMGTVIPMWFAEGVCQYGTQTSTHDWWDSHRDMFLRVRAVEDQLLTLNQMEVFGKNTLESELVYCQGFSLVKFIAQKWGDETLRNLSVAMRSPLMWDFSQACRKVLGISDRQLYQMWKNETQSQYLQGISPLRDHRIEGETISANGNFNLYPRWSPNGKQIAFISNQGKDYLSQASLTMYQIDKKHLVSIP
ncbi:MAG: biopolymer transporter Tol, partial [bacterium]